MWTFNNKGNRSIILCIDDWQLYNGAILSETLLAVKSSFNERVNRRCRSDDCAKWNFVVLWAVMLVPGSRFHAFSHHVRVGFLGVLRFLPTSQRHACMSTDWSKIGPNCERVCECVRPRSLRPAQAVFLPHSQCLQNRLWVQHDTFLKTDEWMSFRQDTL